jgi:molecular chaperone DnaK
VALPGLHTRVRLRRSELEDLIGPALAETVAALQRAFETAAVRPGEADAVILAGGSARITLVGALVSAAIGRSVPPGEQPELAVAMGAARLSLPGADQAISVAFPAVARPFFPIGSSTDPLTTVAPPNPTGSGPASVRPSVSAASPRLVARRGRVWTYRWPIAVGLAGVLVAAGVTIAAAQPRGPSAPPSPPAAPSTAPVALLWKTPTGSRSTEPPAVGADQIVLGTADGRVRGYRRDDGGPLWSVNAGAGARVATGIPGDR